MTDTLFTQDELSQTEPNLPPPGQERREVLAERKDQLEEKAEKIASENDIQSIPHDHKALRPDREIQYDIEHNFLSIENPQPGFVYKWVYFGQGGQAVWKAKYQGWTVVSSEDPENIHQKSADGTRRVGDVLLMKIRMDKHLKILQREEEVRMRREYGVVNEMHEIADKHPKALKVLSDAEGNSPYTEKMQRKSAQRKIAARHLGNQMKKGPIPGVPIK